MRKLTIAFLLPIAALVVVAAILTLPTGQPDALAQSNGTLFGARHFGPNGPSTLYTIDPDTGAATEVGPIGFERCSGMDFDAAGMLFATCEDQSDFHVLITVDPLTGAGTEVGPTGIEGLVVAPRGILGISFRNSDGTLYAYAFDDDQDEFVFGTIDTDTGTMALLATLPDRQFNDGNGIAFSPGDVLFRGDDGELNTLDQGNGEATLVNGLVFPVCRGEEEAPRINAMDFQPGTGVLFGSLNAGSGQQGAKCLVTINTTTAVVTRIGETVAGLDAIAFAPPPTPTPTSTPEPTVLAATATPAPTATPTATPAPVVLPITGGTPSDGGASALPWLAAIAGAIALVGSGSAWFAYQRRRIR